jgi:hypothetical protein
LDNRGLIQRLCHNPQKGLNVGLGRIQDNCPERADVCPGRDYFLAPISALATEDTEF